MAEEEMKTVTLGVSSIEEAQRRMASAFEGQKQGAHLSFESVSLLWKVLTAKRWALLQCMAGQGGISIREAARRAGRDVKVVHGDVRALLSAGVIERTGDGRIVFPYDAVRVDFTLKAA